MKKEELEKLINQKVDLPGKEPVTPKKESKKPTKNTSSGRPAKQQSSSKEKRPKTQAKKKERSQGLKTARSFASFQILDPSLLRRVRIYAAIKDITIAEAYNEILRKGLDALDG